MNADSFFTKGDSHKVCQDYAIHGDLEQCTYAVVCDGCSSSDKVDLGARLLAESLVAVLGTINFEIYQNLPSYPWDQQINHLVQKEVANKLRSLKVTLELQESAFDSTLLAAVFIKQRNRVLVFQWGDGRVTQMFKDGHIEESRLVYSENAPAYFSYAVWRERGGQYNRAFSEQATVLMVTDKELRGGERQWVYCVDPTDLRAIHLTSDGVDSFQDGKDNPTSVAADFIAFKGFQGEFVQRRMNRLLKEFKKEGGGHYDDLGVAAIAFD